MVLVKMLMEIALFRWEERWWWRWRWSPPRREVSPAEQLRQSPRLVPPRFRLMVAEFRPRRLLLIFSHRETSYSRRWPPEGHQGAQETGSAPSREGAPSTLVDDWWPPLVLSLPNIFNIFQNWSSWSFSTFGVVQNRSLIFSPFLVQNSSCRHSPSSCKPYKIREKRHKYYDIMCSNSP